MSNYQGTHLSPSAASAGKSLGVDVGQESLINCDVKMALHVADPQLMDRLDLYLPYHLGQQNLWTRLFCATPHTNKQD